MRQRVALLRTFLAGREVLALDEPFGALDALTRRELQGWLAEVLATDRRTCLLVTHDVDEALWLSDEVLVLSARPARIVTRVRVPFGRPRDPLLVADPAFGAPQGRGARRPRRPARGASRLNRRRRSPRRDAASGVCYASAMSSSSRQRQHRGRPVAPPFRRCGRRRP